MNIPLTGVRHIDMDHSAIINMLDELNNHLDGAFNLNETEYTDILLHILDYCSRHCREEESTMHKINYPGISFHHDKHTEMIFAIKDCLRATMERKITRKENVQKCREIIYDHITRCDSSFATFCKEHDIYL